MFLGSVEQDDEERRLVALYPAPSTDVVLRVGLILLDAFRSGEDVNDCNPWHRVLSIAGMRSSLTVRVLSRCCVV